MLATDILAVSTPVAVPQVMVLAPSAAYLEASIVIALPAWTDSPSGAAKTIAEAVGAAPTVTAMRPLKVSPPLEV